MQQKTIVVANAAAGTRARFRRELEKAGHQVLEAAKATELMDAMQPDPAPPDLLLLDLQLPGGGIDTIATIRRSSPRTIPVLIFSGSIREAPEVRKLASLQVAGYISESCASEQVLPSIAPYLFPDNFNRRGSARISLGIPMAFRHEGSITAATAFDLGKGGIAIRTMAPLETSDKVYTRFRLPGTDTDIETESRVAWSNRRVGMGVQFERVAPAHQAAIDEFVDRPRQESVRPQ